MILLNKRNIFLFLKEWTNYNFQKIKIIFLILLIFYKWYFYFLFCTLSCLFNFFFITLVVLKKSWELEFTITTPTGDIVVYWRIFSPSLLLSFSPWQLPQRKRNGRLHKRNDGPENPSHSNPRKERRPREDPSTFHFLFPSTFSFLYHYRSSHFRFNFARCCC